MQNQPFTRKNSNKQYNQLLMELNNQYLLDHLRSIPDFPKKGINFRDVTTLFKDAKALEIMEEQLYELYKDKGITKVVGLETRGYVMGAILARRLNAGFIMARKPGKLPYKTISESYTKEYGTDSIEIHVDALDENDVVLLHDDLLATGGTIKAAWNLVKKFNPKKCYMNFVVEIRDEGLHGREAIGDGIEVTTLIRI
jgi:adenine phosphoribosyltransferase